MLITFNLLLDDIVFPDGRTAMGVLGGGGPQTAFGARLWGERAGLVAEVGADLPEAAWAWLKACGIDTRGVRAIDSIQTPRAWQVTEADGRRTQVWRVRPASARTLDALPEAYHHAQGFHLGLHPDDPDLEFIAALRRLGGGVSLELFRPAERRPDPPALYALLSAASVFSANLPEAVSLVGPGSPRSVARRLVEAAESRAQLMIVRLAEEGSLVVEGQTGKAARVPAVPVDVVNTVGAGNAYCGGFLAGWERSHDLARAGACGAVAASFAVAQTGLPVITPALQAEAQRRIEALMPLVEYTSL
jgi:cytidine kinase